MDPEDTRILDDVVRFIGQRVAAVVAESEAAAEEACRRLKVEYEILPALVDPERAMEPGAAPSFIPIEPPRTALPTPGATSSRRHMASSATPPPRSRRPPSPSKAPSTATASSTPRWRPMAASPGSTIPACSTSAARQQVPFLTRRALSGIFALPMDKVRVFCERVGGGFGGKQEMFVEDILALAALKTGRPVKLELTREEQFIATSTRHPMRVHIKAGADADGKLTALSSTCSPTPGAYGDHAGPRAVPRRCQESISRLQLLPQQERRRRSPSTPTPVPAGGGGGGISGLRPAAGADRGGGRDR